jgi:sugar phosphate isomerase/epimerase
MSFRSLAVVLIAALWLSLAVGCHAARPTPFERASCSTLVKSKQPLEPALKTVADMGFKYADVMCLWWVPHVNVDSLVKDFDAEAARAEKALADNKLKVSNFTFDDITAKPFDEYKTRFTAVVKLAVRLKAPLINVMAPPAKSDRADMIAKLKVIHKIAADHGIKLTLETHMGQMTEIPADAEKICKEIPGLGLTLDPSHYYAGPNQGKSFDNLYPYVMNTGFRAGGMTPKTIQMPWGQGPIDFAAVVRKLEAGGYKGYYVVEYLEGLGDVDSVASSKAFLEWMKKQ